MKLWQKLTGVLFGAAIEDIVEERIEAAVNLSADEPGFRKLTGSSTRELPIATQERQIEIAYWLWKTNPLANWIIETIKDFALAEGLPWSAKNEKVQEVLEGFWKDPLNQMDLYLENLVRELGIYGEQCLPVFVAEQTGRVRLGYVDPAQIDKVVTDPENVKIAIGVKLKSESGVSDGKKYRIILDPEAENLISKRAKNIRRAFTAGECFYFAINRVTNEPRGTSDLFTLADWLDGYEQFLFDYADKWPLLNSFIWDVELEGFTPDQIKQWLKENKAPKPGSMRAHNEKVKWEAVTPDLKAEDASDGARLLRNHVLGAKSLPEHWYGGAADVNRATAAEMGTPTFKMISSRQNLVGYIVETLLRYQARKANEAKYLSVSDQELYDITVQRPEVAQKDISKFSAALQSLSNSLVVAQANGWLTQEKAAQIYAFGLAFVGYELSAEDAAEEAGQADEEEGFEDYTGETAEE